jgi:hypothetical protein
MLEQIKVYRLDIEIETDKGTAKTHKTGTEARINYWKSKIRSGAPRGSVIDFRVREV